jgi:hypothetical protein
MTFSRSFAARSALGISFGSSSTISAPAIPLATWIAVDP